MKQKEYTEFITLTEMWQDGKNLEVGDLINKEEWDSSKVAEFCAYLNKYLGINKTFSDVKLKDATHVVMNNRAFLDVTYNEYVKGLVDEDAIRVKMSEYLQAAKDRVSNG